MDIDELTEPESDFIDDDDEDEKPAKKAKAPAKKAPAKKAPPPKKAPAKAESSESKKDDVKEEDKKPKFKYVTDQRGDIKLTPHSYRAYAATKAAGPANPGSKDIPEGQPDCLAGLTFVFTGELDSLSREDATELVKRYAGWVKTT
jgi:replication factor C subunit 1